MKNESEQQYPKSPAQREGIHSATDENPHGDESMAISRRRFLEAAGFTFSLVALNGCSRAPTETALR